MDSDLIKKKKKKLTDVYIVASKTETGFFLLSERKKVNPLENSRMCYKLIRFLPPSVCGQTHVLFCSIIGSNYLLAKPGCRSCSVS